MLNEMKSRYSGKKLAVLFLIVSLLTNFSFAQKNEGQNKINSSAMKNLIMALNSENMGLKRSAVYFAGYYKIQKTVDPLIDLLNTSSNDLRVRTLAAYSLHQIGDEDCLNALKYAANNAADKELCFKCKLMYEDLMQNKSGVVIND